MLGVSPSATTVAILSELGRFPMQLSEGMKWMLMCVSPSDELDQFETECELTIGCETSEGQHQCLWRRQWSFQNPWPHYILTPGSWKWIIILSSMLEGCICVGPVSQQYVVNLHSSKGYSLQLVNWLVHLSEQASLQHC